MLVSLSGFAFGYDVGSVRPSKPLVTVGLLSIFPVYSALSGVMDMQDYRSTLNVSYLPPDSNPNSTTGSCDSQDDVETAAILVSRNNDGIFDFAASNTPPTWAAQRSNLI